MSWLRSAPVCSYCAVCASASLPCCVQVQVLPLPHHPSGWEAGYLSELVAFVTASIEPSLPCCRVLYNLNALIFMLPFGLAFAVCARIGACLGAGQYKLAKLSAEVGCLFDEVQKQLLQRHSHVASNW